MRGNLLTSLYEGRPKGNDLRILQNKIGNSIHEQNAVLKDILDCDRGERAKLHT